MNQTDIVTKNIGVMLGFEKYKMIMEQVQKTDLSCGEKSAISFRKLYIDYYKVRRNETWQTEYFNFFQKNKSNNDISFNEIIDYCYNNMKTVKGKPHPVEASFSSKMLATIKPEKPVLDSQVLTNMKLDIYGTKQNDKLKSAKAVYGEIEERYKRYWEDDCSVKAIALFDQHFPDYIDLPATKKIDWFLWGFKREDLEAMGLFGGLLNG